MSTPDQSKGDRSRDEVLAGEYVLGVLGVPERAEVQARLRHDREFAAVVRRWEDNLVQFNDDYADASPPEGLFDRIEQRIFPIGQGHPADGRSLWNSLLLWRAMSLVSLSALALVVGLDWADRIRPQPAAPLTAELVGDKSDIALIASYDGLSGRLSFTPVAAGGSDQKSLELWLVEGEGPPISLGVLPQTGQGEVEVPQALRSRMIGGVVLAVSLEPFGGSPTGQATGPVIALGAVQR